MISELEKFSKRLKELRESRGLKQTEMAAVLDRSGRNYQRLEYGELNVPATTLMLLADYFGVTTDYLLGRSDDGGPQGAV